MIASNALNHRYGLMRYCEKCGMSMLEAVQRQVACTAPNNVRSVANELAYKKNFASSGDIDAIVNKWFPKVAR